MLMLCHQGLYDDEEAMMDTEAMAKANPHMDPTGKRTGESKHPPRFPSRSLHHCDVTAPALFSTPHSGILWLTVWCCRP